MKPDNSNEVPVVVREEGQHTHFSQIPHIIDDMNLSSVAIRLYLHLKRVAGENGSCYQSERTIAQHCHMGRNTIPRVKMELIKAGLISVADETINGKQFRILIICNIWAKNGQHFQALKEKKREEAALNSAPRLQTAPLVALNSADGVALNSAQRIYPTKEEPTKKITTAPGEKVKNETFEVYQEELRERFADLDFYLEFEKFNLYWSGNGRKLKNPKLALLNWLTKARKIQQEERPYGQNRGTLSKVGTQSLTDRIEASIGRPLV